MCSFCLKLRSFLKIKSFGDITIFDSSTPSASLFGLTSLGCKSGKLISSVGMFENESRSFVCVA